MSNEVHIDYESGYTLYGVVYNSAGQVNVSGSNNFENWGAGGHDADDYDFSIAEVGSGGTHYVGSFPTTITTADRYTVAIFRKLGANPVNGDDFIGSGEIVWNGSAESENVEKAAKVIINKAIQNKTTGKIDYYDDDGSTILLSHTPTDAEATITRTPS